MILCRKVVLSVVYMYVEKSFTDLNKMVKQKKILTFWLLLAIYLAKLMLFINFYSSLIYNPFIKILLSIVFIGGLL